MVVLVFMVFPLWFKWFMSRGTVTIEPARPGRSVLYAGAQQMEWAGAGHADAGG